MRAREEDESGYLSAAVNNSNSNLEEDTSDLLTSSLEKSKIMDLKPLGKLV